MENLGGRPPHYNNAEELLEKAEEYFNSVSKPTITRLCLHLGFESRQSFYAYEQKEGFSYAIKRLRTRIEAEYEDLVTDKDHATAGVIFALKNLGWSDKTEIDHTSAGEKLDTSTKIVFSKGSKK
jgi:hypothetical protein